jgi:hypothetical protein
MLRMWRMLVTVIEYRQPVLCSKGVSCLRCRRVGRTRRTSNRIPSGRPARVYTPVSSATKDPSWRLPSWCTEVSHAVSGSLARACSSSGVIFQPTV